MNFMKIYLFLLSFLAVAFAAPSATTSAPPAAPTCSTGSLQCCNTVEAASSSGVGIILALLGIVLESLDVIVGLTCSPITIIGVGGGSGW